MRKGVWFTIVFVLSLCLMIFPPVIFVLIIKTSIFQFHLKLKDKTIQEACDVNEMGLNFSVVFMQNHYISQGFTYFLDIYPTLRNQNKVDVSVNWSSTLAPNVSDNVQTTIAPNEHKVIEVPSSLQMGLVEQSMKGVTIRASDKIGVYAMNRRESTCDGFLVLPNHLLGKDHYVVCFFPQDRQTQMAFVAIEDKTTVVVVLRNKTRPGIGLSWLGTKYTNGDNVTFNLSKGEAVHIQASTDLTGCGVHSNKPIAVFAGNDVTRVANNLSAGADSNFTWAGNHLVEQIPDISHWGSMFYLAPFVFKFNGTADSPGYLIKVVCSERNTSINFYFVSGNTSSYRCTDSGDNYKTFVQGYDGLSIRSTRPILVAQIFASSVDLSPSMLLITPAEKFNSYYVFPTPKSHSNGSFYHFLQITMAANETERLVVDDKPLGTAVKWSSFNDSSGFVWSSFELVEGIHTLRHDRNIPFGASIVGHSKTPRFCSYAYPAGLCS